MLDVRVVRKFSRDYPELLSSINKKFLNEAATILLTEAKDRTPVNTGLLRLSIKNKVTSDQAIIGTNVYYAPYVEYGTKRTKAQPFLRPALDAKRRDLRQRWVSLFRKVFRTMGRL